MRVWRFSMRISLGLTVIVMGLLGLGLALATGEIYRQETLENHRTALVGMLKLKTHDLLKDLEARSRDLGLTAQGSTEFQRAFDRRDERTLAGLMENQFHQYFVTASVVNLQELHAFDLDFNPIAIADDGSPIFAKTNFVCSDLAAQARQRQGPARLRVLSGPCVAEGRPFFTVIVPIGGLRPKGYLEVVSDPTPNLIPVETALGMPVKLTWADGKVAYKSRAWPAPDAMAQTLVAKYTLVSERSEPILTVAVLEDIHQLERKLAHIRYAVTAFAALIILAVVTAALIMLHRTMLRPLTALKQHLRLVREDPARLGEQLPPGRNAELNELTQDFNALSAELRNMHQTLEHAAFTDALTNLPNRMYFHEQLRQRAAASGSTESPFALFVMDLDRFKEVNDTFGHDIGDQLLKQVSARMRGVLRHSDIFTRLDEETVAKLGEELIARLGGDEFAAIVPDIADAKQAAAVAQKLVKSMEQPFIVGMHRLNIGISIGIALYPEHGVDATTLLREADVAMYQAKQNKVGYAFFSSSQHSHKLVQMTLESELRQAIEGGDLELYYQPVVSAKTREVTCAEAVVRWHSANNELMLPDSFIPLAEQSGLIKPLTRWVLGRAVEQCTRWRGRGIPIDVAVNLSVMNLHEPDFVESVREVLNKWKAEPSWLTLELTESAVMSDPRHALEVLSRLNAVGVRVSIDDFGAGYSSLACLKKLPVSEIKIDASFVAEIKHGRPDGIDTDDAVIVRSTIDLAHNMNLQVVVEGVENTETLQLLASLGCDRAQGYFISPPLTYDELLKWLGRSEWSIKQLSTINDSEKPRPAVSPRRTRSGSLD